MEKENKNKYIAVMYRLYIDGSEGKPELVEATAEGDPFIFIIRSSLFFLSLQGK